MSIIGGNAETKEIGLQIGVGGTHQNTELNNMGYLTLAVENYDDLGNPVYAAEGTWISKTVDIGDNFQDFNKVFLRESSPGSSRYAVLTRVSKDNLKWSDWQAVALDGTIQSDTEQYIQIKIDLFAGFLIGKISIGDFNAANSVNLFTPNDYIETNGGLKLKRNYEFDMTIDNSWTENGSLHRKKITRDEWLRIDKLVVN